MLSLLDRLKDVLHHSKAPLLHNLPSAGGFCNPLYGSYHDHHAFSHSSGAPWARLILKRDSWLPFLPAAFQIPTCDERWDLRLDLRARNHVGV